MRNMNTDEYVIFVNLQGASEDTMEKMYAEMCETDGGWVLKAIHKRFEAHDLPTDKKTQIMVLSMGDGVVGRCAKYVDDIVEKAHGLDLQELSFKDFAQKIYPWDFPEF